MRTLHAVNTATLDRRMPTNHQPTVERVLDGEHHIVRVELGHWTHEHILDLFKTLDEQPRLRALVLAELSAGGDRPHRHLRRAHIAHEVNHAMSMVGRTTHEMDPEQADDLAEALTEAAVDASVCRHDSYRGDCDNLTDGEFCTLHDGQVR